MDQKTPHFELRRVYDHGAEQDEPQVYPILDLPMDTKMDRRGFLGAGITMSAVLALVAGCAGPQQRTPVKRVKKPPAAKPTTTQKPVVAEKEQPAPPKDQAHTCSADIKAHSKSVNILAFSRDGKWLASGSADKTIKVWSMPEGKLHKTLKKHSSAVRSLRFSGNGRWLVSAADDGKVRIWKPASGKLHKSLSVGSTADVSPDGKWLVTRSSKSKKAIAVHTFPAGKLRKMIKGHVGRINELAISANGR